MLSELNYHIIGSFITKKALRRLSGSIEVDGSPQIDPSLLKIGAASPKERSLEISPLTFSNFRGNGFTFVITEFIVSLPQITAIEN